MTIDKKQSNHRFICLLLPVPVAIPRKREYCLGISDPKPKV
jgi:hypothetical protein